MKNPLRNTTIEALEQRIAPATLVGLTTTNQLVTFDSAEPSGFLSVAKIHGLATGDDIVSLDTRAANGLLYALGKKGNLYTLNPFSGVASLIGPGGLTLAGKTFAMDFNPTVDRLRVVSDAEQNFRFNPNTGIVVDGDGGAAGIQPDTALAFDAADANATKNPNIAAVAYDRNFQGATQTTLFAVDTTLNALVRIGSVDGVPTSPNGGVLFTIGALGVDPVGPVGFDITANGAAFATMTVKGKTKLYSINLTTGAATEAGIVGKGTLKLDSVTALPLGEIVFAVTQSNRLISFRADNPGHLESVTGIKGLLAGETVRGLDFRPATGELIALTNTNRMLVIDPSTARATQLGVPLVTTPQFSVSSPAGFDFNPSADRLRLVNAANDNLRWSPPALAPVDTDGNAANGNTPDTSLAYIATDPNVGADPNITGVAYDRNDNDIATATTLFAIDSTFNNLVRQGAVDGNGGDTAGGGSPNGGLLTTLGSLGVDPTDNVGFDISDRGALGSGGALAVMQLQGESGSKLFSINLTAGLTNQPLGFATLIGAVGTGDAVTAMAIAPAQVQFSAANFLTIEKVGGTAVIKIKRTGGTGSAVSVNFSTFDGTAFAGLDYTALQNFIVTFAPGETLKTVAIPILKDTIKELDETIVLSLASVTGGSAVLSDLITSIATIRRN